MVSIVFLWNVTYDRTVGLVESDVFGQFCFTSNFISEDDFPHELGGLPMQLSRECDGIL